MQSLELNELITAMFELEQSFLHLKAEQNNCHLADLKLRLAVQSQDLAITQYQQAQIALALTRLRQA